MKIVKKILKVLLWIVGIVVVLVLALPLWIGPVAEMAANAIVPKKTQTRFRLGDFGLNYYTGKLKVGDVQLGNPEKFKPEMAFTLASLNVDFDVSSLASDVIHIRDITIQDVYVSYLREDGESNFDVIKRNVAGEDGASEEAKTEATGSEAEVKSAEVKATEVKEAEVAEEEKPSKKVIIDRLSISGILVQLGPITLPVPPITLTDIGKESGGIDWVGAWNEISAQVMQKLGALGGGIKDLGSFLGEKSTDAVGTAVDAVKDLNVDKAVDKAGEHVDKAVNALKGLFK